MLNEIIQTELKMLFYQFLNLHRQIFEDFLFGQKLKNKLIILPYIVQNHLELVYGKPYAPANRDEFPLHYQRIV